MVGVFGQPVQLNAFGRPIPCRWCQEKRAKCEQHPLDGGRCGRCIKMSLECAPVPDNSDFYDPQRRGNIQAPSFFVCVRNSDKDSVAELSIVGRFEYAIE